MKESTAYQSIEEQRCLTLKVFDTREHMGNEAAKEVCAVIHKLQEEKEEINMVFAAAPSQLDFLRIFREDTTIDFKRIHAFHMDEYLGLPKDAPQGFGNFLNRHLFSKVKFGSVDYIDGSCEDVEGECKRYMALLQQYRPDIVCLGIGENGHIAFNDPSVADFEDSKIVKSVDLDETCRQQQVNDGCFKRLEQVPNKAITLTVPALLNADYHFCVVPAKNKAIALYKTLYGAVSTDCPASVLRTCQKINIYADEQSSSLL